MQSNGAYTTTRDRENENTSEHAEKFHMSFVSDKADHWPNHESRLSNDTAQRLFVRMYGFMYVYNVHTHRVRAL